MHVCALMLLDEYVRNTLVACYVAIKRMSLVPCERAHHLPLPEQRWGRRECCVQRFLGDRETDVSPDPGSAVCPSPAAWLQPAPPSRTPPQRNPALDFPHPEPAATHTHTVFRDQKILPKACDCGTSLQPNFLSALARHDYFIKPKNEQFHSFSLKFSTGCILNNGSKIYLQIWAPLGCAEP